MTGDHSEIDRSLAAASEETGAIESVGEVLPRLEIAQEAWRRFVGLDLSAPRPPTVRHSWTVRR